MSVSIVRIHPAPDGSKQGVDDYLAAGGDLDDLEVLPFEGGWIPPRDWPTLAKDAFQGLASEVLNSIAPNTESDPVAILALFLAAYVDSDAVANYQVRLAEDALAKALEGRMGYVG